jgi:septal ring factor EnvC (AmiA/AmiB activator)
MEWIELIPTLGFPIVCCLVLGWFVFKIYQDTNKQNAENMKAVQERCAKREEKLYNEIEKNQEINAQAIAVITRYADSLDNIEQDIKEIKTDLTILTAKAE